MTAIQSCMPQSTQGSSFGTYSTPLNAGGDLGRVERVLQETRRVLGALDRELDEIRATRQAAAQSQQVQDESGPHLMESAPLPRNVVSVSRDLFTSETPQEVVLDPALEKATVEELNAALADAFNHVGAR